MGHFLIHVLVCDHLPTVSAPEAATFTWRLSARHFHLSGRACWLKIDSRLSARFQALELGVGIALWLGPRARHIGCSCQLWVVGGSDLTHVCSAHNRMGNHAQDIRDMSAMALETAPPESKRERWGYLRSGKHCICLELQSPPIQQKEVPYLHTSEIIPRTEPEDLCGLLPSACRIVIRGHRQACYILSRWFDFALRHLRPTTCLLPTISPNCLLHQNSDGRPSSARCCQTKSIPWILCCRRPVFVEDAAGKSFTLCCYARSPQMVTPCGAPWPATHFASAGLSCSSIGALYRVVSTSRLVNLSDLEIRRSKQPGDDRTEEERNMLVPSLPPPSP